MATAQAMSKSNFAGFTAQHSRVQTRQPANNAAVNSSAILGRYLQRHGR